MILQLKIILYFIYYSLKKWVNPYMFFQNHVDQFNWKKWIFSKYEIEKKIPKKWKLRSEYYSQQYEVNIRDNYNFPFFLKPEWGQNSKWIYAIQNVWDFQNFSQKILKWNVNYIVQEWVIWKEFEISFTRNNQDITIWSLVESVNTQWELIHCKNCYTEYIERIYELSQTDIESLKSMVQEIEPYSFARIWLKAESLRHIIDWKLKIFEINIFVPLPLFLLAENIRKPEKNVFLKRYLQELVCITKNRKKLSYEEVFLKKTYMHFKLLFQNLW